MKPAALSAILRQRRGEAERSGWTEGALTLLRAEESVAAGHLSGRGRWYRQARKAMSQLVDAALNARAAADTARAVASPPAPTAAQLTAKLPHDPARAAARLRELIRTRAYKDEIPAMREVARELDFATAKIQGVAADIEAARTLTLQGADDSCSAADNCLVLLHDLLDEAAYVHTARNG